MNIIENKDGQLQWDIPEESVDLSDYISPGHCIPNIVRANLGLPPIDEYQKLEHKIREDRLERILELEKKNKELYEDGYALSLVAHLMTYRWNKLKKWLENQKENRKWDGDFQRYTAYEAALKEMEELERE